jgi:hypothetical protein
MQIEFSQSKIQFSPLSFFESPARPPAQPVCQSVGHRFPLPFLSARKADLKKGFQHLVVLVVVVVVVFGHQTGN